MRSESARPVRAGWSGPIWKSRLARRLLILLGFAALLLGVLSFREVSRETAQPNRQNRFQFTKARAMYLHHWLEMRRREMEFCAHHLSHRHRASATVAEQRTLNGAHRTRRPPGERLSSAWGSEVGSEK